MHAAPNHLTTPKLSLVEFSWTGGAPGMRLCRGPQ